MPQSAKAKKAQQAAKAKRDAKATGPSHGAAKKAATRPQNAVALPAALPGVACPKGHPLLPFALPASDTDSILTCDVCDATVRAAYLCGAQHWAVCRDCALQDATAVVSGCNGAEEAGSGSSSVNEDDDAELAPLQLAADFAALACDAFNAALDAASDADDDDADGADNADGDAMSTRGLYLGLTEAQLLAAEVASDARTAVSRYKGALALQRQLHDAHAPQVTETLCRLGDASRFAGQHDAYVECFREAAALAQSAPAGVYAPGEVARLQELAETVRDESSLCDAAARDAVRAHHHAVPGLAEHAGEEDDDDDSATVRPPPQVVHVAVKKKPRPPRTAVTAAAPREEPVAKKGRTEASAAPADSLARTHGTGP